MGITMKTQYKNYTPPKLFRELPTLNLVPTDPHSAVYCSHAIPSTFEVPCYSFKREKAVAEEQLRGWMAPKPDELRLLTYNVWFQAHNSEVRYEMIIRMMEDSGADFICLQEVNQHFLSLLHGKAKQSARLRQYYQPLTKMHWYDTLILSRYPCRFYKKAFETSGMGRCMLTAVVELQDKDKVVRLAVNSVHLESLNFEKQRMNQLRQIGEMNKLMDVLVIAGDFNFSDGWSEDKALADYKDLWKEGVRHFSPFATKEMREGGFTMPQTEQFPPWRPDHIIYRSTLKKGEEKDEIEIVGDFTVPPFEQDRFDKVKEDRNVRTPSDHFGLIGKIGLSRVKV